MVSMGRGVNRGGGGGEGRCKRKRRNEENQKGGVWRGKESNISALHVNIHEFGVGE
jgi:hypothetical protein